jgi:hypothetical protein
MPYIEPARRQWLDARTVIAQELPQTKGELNYVITRAMVSFVARRGKTYHTISDAIAAAQDAADEFKRRVLAPYESTKIAQNGDVYTEILP